MQTLIPLRPAALTHALDLSRRLDRRARLEAPSRISRDLWAVTVEAALARRHLGVAAGLLRAELLTAVAEAMAALGEAVTLASTPAAARPWPWLVEVLPRLDHVAQRLSRACQVVTVAERHRQLRTGGSPPLSRPSGGVSRVLGRVLADLAAVVEGDDGWPAVTEHLGDALCALVGPVTATVERLDASDLEGVALRPLKRALFAAHEAVAEALLFALGRLGSSPDVPQPARARAS